MTSPDILDIVPEHVVDPVRRAPWPVRLGTALGDGLLSVVLNAVVVGWLAGIGWPAAPAEAPAAISVDLVDHMPGEKGGGGSGLSGASPAAKTSEAAVRKEAGGPAPETPKAEQPAAEQPPAPPAAATPQPPPASPPDRQAASVPPTPPPVPPPEQQAASPSPAPAETAPTPTPPAPAVPAPLEHPDSAPQPRLVEAPRPPREAETQTDAKQPPVVTDADTSEAKRPGPPPAQPKVIAADRAEEAVPTPAPPPPKTPAQLAEEKRQAENTAALAAVLPFGANVSSDPFRAQVSAQGQALDEAYRGAVYDNFNTKAGDIQEEARARHLKGTAVVAFSVDGDGNLADSGIALSSGQPEVDQMALAMIRRAAPFPPPPPGAQRSFSTALSFGGGG